MRRGARERARTGPRGRGAGAEGGRSLSEDYQGGRSLSEKDYEGGRSLSEKDYQGGRSLSEKDYQGSRSGRRLLAGPPDDSLEPWRPPRQTAQTPTLKRIPRASGRFCEETRAMQMPEGLSRPPGLVARRREVKPRGGSRHPWASWTARRRRTRRQRHPQPLASTPGRSSRGSANPWGRTGRGKMLINMIRARPEPERWRSGWWTALHSVSSPGIMWYSGVCQECSLSTAGCGSKTVPRDLSTACDSGVKVKWMKHGKGQP